MSTISTQPIPIRGAISDNSGMVTKPWVEYFRSLQVIATAGIYVVANAAITAGTHTKITYDEKGLVTLGVDATTTDIPEGINLYYTDARVLALIASSGLINNNDDYMTVGT